MTTSTEVQPLRSAATGGLAGLGVAGWLGTMSSHTARAYAGDLRQFTGWLAGRGIGGNSTASKVRRSIGFGERQRW